MKVLITGIPGWLGGRFLEILTKGFDDKAPAVDWQIRCLVLPGMDTSFIKNLEKESRYQHRIEVVSGDVTRKETLREAVKGVDTDFHIVGIIHPKKIKDLYDINTAGTFNLVNEAFYAGVRRFVHVSSNSVAGTNLKRHLLMKEEDEPRPYMNYGLSKYYAECVVRSFQETGKMETVILRPCWFYGPNQPKRQTKFFKMIEKGNPIVFGDGLNFRSMSYVDNTSQAMLLAATRKEAVGQTYWIADSRPYTTLEIYSTVAELLEVKNFKPRFLPGFSSEVFLRADKMLQAAGKYQTEIHVAGEMNKDIACSIGKARAELGYEPKVELKE
ncbi:MAG: NAD(P)-dependent oxidoreductase, partial [Candidatus Omnitrophica bacterium]|nr:NAD(P)-dependent oxidoreductase [Candidatus Omnitrophota bacterium]